MTVQRTSNQLRSFLRREPLSGRVILYKELGFYGRLGNQLWQVAGTLGLADSLGGEARFPDWPYQRHFRVPDRHFSTVTPPGEDAWSIPEHLPAQYRYYLQDVSLWLHIERRIRKYFRPSPATRSAMERKFRDLLAIPNKAAVHVRRTDYVNLAEHHPPVTVEYLKLAISALPPANIVVFSDEQEWCRDHLSWAGPLTFVEGNEDYEDLFLMTRCNHHVIANSSFSWWGAFLSRNRRPIYPRRWYGPAKAEIDPTLMFLPGWIGIDA